MVAVRASDAPTMLIVLKVKGGVTPTIIQTFRAKH